MSDESNARHVALFILCLASSSLESLEEWIPDDEPDLDWFNRPRNPNEPAPDWFDQTQAWKPEEIHLDDGRILVLEYT